MMLTENSRNLFVEMHFVTFIIDRRRPQAGICQIKIFFLHWFDIQFRKMDVNVIYFVFQNLLKLPRSHNIIIEVYGVHI